MRSLLANCGGDSDGRPATVGGALVPFDRLRNDRWGREVLALVARELCVPPLLLLHRSRCSAEIAQARQIAMYLMHVILQRKYYEVGRFFRRDRTTVAHACAQVEDLRDQREFDARIERMEEILGAASKGLEGGPRRAAG